MTTYSKNGKRIGRPPGKQTREEHKALHPNEPGTKEKVIEQLTRYVENPDKPMVAPHLAIKLEAFRHMDVAPNKLFADGGKHIDAVTWLARKAEVSSPPKTPEETYDAFEQFMAWSADNQVPPTIGAWAVWNGVTLVRMNQIEQDVRDLERSRAFGVCKEVLRTFMEQAAWDNLLNPLLYFHSQKALYGIVERSEVVVKVEDNTRELSDEEYSERVGMLTLEQGEDGVYR